MFNRENKVTFLTKQPVKVNKVTDYLTEFEGAILIRFLM